MERGKGFESTTADKTEPGDRTGQLSGSDVQQGLHGSSTRTAARGRDEQKHQRADSAALDRGERVESAGRHYGRSGTEEPGPGMGHGALQPDEGTVARRENDGVDFSAAREPETASPPSRTQGLHGDGGYAQGRDAGARKQTMPGEGARTKK